MKNVCWGKQLVDGEFIAQDFSARINRMQSKIEATDRLRREGRWAEASLKRDEFRRQYRLEGAKRDDANERAWQAMCDAFPPLTDHQIGWLPAYRYMAMAGFPPDCVDDGATDHQPSLAAVWWLWAYCLARLSRWSVKDWDGADFVANEMMVHDFEEIDRACDHALREPIHFLRSVVAERFSRVAEQLWADGDENSIYIREFDANVAFIERIVSQGVESTMGADITPSGRIAAPKTRRRRKSDAGARV